MYIQLLASCLLLALANANGSLASTYSNSTLASLVGTTANAQANTDSCFDTILTCNIDDDDEDETGSVKYYDGFLSPDESKQYVDTDTIEKSAEHPAAEASYNHIKVGASLGNRMKQLLIPSYTPTTSYDNDNDNDDIMLQTRSIYESTHRHVDHYTYTPDHKGIRKVVEERLAFVFLTDNKSAKFNAGGKSIPAVAGRLVTFRGNIVHGTTIKNKGGHVHLLGPFAVKTFADVGCGFCPNGVPSENLVTSITIESVSTTCGSTANLPNAFCDPTDSGICYPDCVTVTAEQTCCPLVWPVTTTTSTTTSTSTTPPETTSTSTTRPETTSTSTTSTTRPETTSTSTTPSEPDDPEPPACPYGQSLKTFCAADECKEYTCIDPHKVKVCIKHGLGKMDGEEESDSSNMLRVPTHFLPDSVELCLPVIAAQAVISIGHADCGACEPV